MFSLCYNCGKLQNNFTEFCFLVFFLKESRHSLITFIFSSFTGRAMLSEGWKNEDFSQEMTLESKNFTWILQR